MRHASVMKICSLLPLFWVLVAAPQAGAVTKLVVFDIELMGDRGGPELAQIHQARQKLASDRMRQELARGAVYEIIDTAPVREQIQRLQSEQYLHICNGCELDVARQLGAEQALVAWVNRVSQLILSLNYEIRDVNSGEVVRKGAFDFRGDNDDSWIRAVTYMARKLNEQGGAAQ